MKIEVIRCKDSKTAKRLAPWAAKVAKVVGGYLAFESIAEWQVWRNQR